jgi:aminomethyltransferase
MELDRDQLKHTPLTSIHEALGARMVPFAGYRMPVSYSSILEEHQTVRERAGLFDVSHMGEILITGPKAQDFVNRIITNDCSKLEPGGVQYTVMCRENGTVVDDLLVSVIAPDRILLVVNAVNRRKDFEFIMAHGEPDVYIDDVSDSYALLAVQGPRSREVLAGCPVFAPAAERLEEVPYYHFFTFKGGGFEITISRTGYTGELGFEVFTPPGFAPVVWTAIMEAGKPLGLMPVGLAARDTLRFEASFCLYGQEMDDETSPLQAGLGWVVKLNKERFIGKQALTREKEAGSPKTLIGLELEGRAIARHGFPVEADGRPVGRVTSGNFAPTLGKSCCLAFIKTEALANRKQFAVEVRGKPVPAHRVPLPFYKSRAR